MLSLLELRHPSLLPRTSESEVLVLGLGLQDLHQAGAPLAFFMPPAFLVLQLADSRSQRISASIIV